ncbi:MAG: OsmC family protein [Bacteroidota bacterium]
MVNETNILLKQKQAPLNFEVHDELGHVLYTDSSPETGGVNGGFRPMTLLLAGVASCSSIDVVLILQKQKYEVKDIQVAVKGVRADSIPSVFTDIHLAFHVEGEIPAEKVKRAIDLSMEKYCSVAAMLNKVATITYEFTLNEEKVPS